MIKIRPGDTGIDLYGIVKRHADLKQHVEDVGELLAKLSALKDELGRAHRALDAGMALERAVAERDATLLAAERGDFCLALAEVPSHAGSAHYRRVSK